MKIWCLTPQRAPIIAPIDKKSGCSYLLYMITTAILKKELETLPEGAAAAVLDFVRFMKKKHTLMQPEQIISIKDAYGIFKDLKGMDTTIERDEEDRL